MVLNELSHKTYNWLSLDTIRSIEEAIEKYSPLGSIISRLCEMIANGKFEVLNRRTQNYTRGEYKEWDAFLETPNPNQTRIEFLKELSAYILLNGYCYVRPMYASGFKDRPSALWILPPWATTVELIPQSKYFRKKEDNIRKIKFTWNNQQQTFLESELILFKDPGSLTTCKETLLPESRVKDLVYPLSNGIGAMESRHSLIQDRGASGILANSASDVHGAIPVPAKETDRLQNEYNKRYGLTKNKKYGHVIVTNQPLKWQSMSFDVQQLRLHEEHDENKKDVCDRYGFPYRLLSTPEGATYENMQWDLQRTYTDMVMPFAETLIARLNDGLNTPAQNIELCLSYEHIPVMQESEEQRGQGRKALNEALQLEWDNGLITRNMWLEELEEDTVNMPEFDLYKWQLTPEQLGIVNTDINGNSGQGGAGSQQGSQNQSGN